MQPCNRIYYSKIYWRLNMFRKTYRSSSGAPNCICSLWFIYPCGNRPLSRMCGNSVPTQSGQRPVTTWVYKPEAANTVWSFWWWAVCRSKHVKPSVNFGIINSITRLHLVGYFYWFVDQILSSGCGCQSVDDEIPRTSWKPEIPDQVYNILLLVPSLHQV